MASRERHLTHEKKFSGPLYIPLRLFTQEMKGACREHKVFACLCVGIVLHFMESYCVCVGEGGGGGGRGGRWRFHAGIAQWLERRTRDRKVAGSSGRSGGKMFFSRVNFLC